MLRRTFATFDPLALGPNLETLQAGRLLTTTASSLDAHRMARATISLHEDDGYVEFMAYDGVVGAGEVYVGLVTASASLTGYVGEDAFGYGYRLDSGAVYSSAGVVDTFTAAAAGDVIGLLFTAATSTMTIFKNGAQIGSIDLPRVGSPDETDTWFPAATVSGAVAGDLTIFINAGQQSFTGTDGIDGWWEPIVTTSALLIGSEPYISRPTDGRPDLVFDGTFGRIEADESFCISQHVQFWTDAADSGVQVSVSSLRICDPEHYYDNLLTDDLRDVPITLQALFAGDSLDDAQQLGTFLIDRVETDGDDYKVVYLRENTAVLEDPLQPRLFLPNADAGAAWETWPTVIGGPRTFEPRLYDDAHNRYAASDEPMHGLGAIRIRGVEAAPTTDFLISPDLLGFDLQDSTLIPDGHPSGKFTAEISIVGGEFDPGDPDYLDGIGSPFAGADGDLPTGWADRFTSLGPDTLPHADGTGVLVFPCQYVVRSNIVETDKPLRAGRSYAYSIHVNQTVLFGEGGLKGDGYAQLVIGGYFDASGAYFPPSAIIRLGPDDVGTYTGTFSNPSTLDLPCYLTFFCNNTVTGAAKVSEFKLVELPDVLTNAALTGATLEQYITKVLEKLGKLPATAWAHATAASIDADTGYQIGNWWGTQTSKREALRPALDSFGCAMFQRLDGVLDLARLRAPEDAYEYEYAFALTESNILEPIHVRQDPARGLVSSLGVTRNISPYGPGDFDDDTVAVPVTVRRILQSMAQATCYSGQQLAAMYAFARLAKPFLSLFDLVADGAAEIDRVTAIYTRLRLFFEQVVVDWQPGTEYRIGSIGTLSYTDGWYGTNAKPVQIRGVDLYPLAQRAVITAWG